MLKQVEPLEHRSDFSPLAREFAFRQFEQPLTGLPAAAMALISASIATLDAIVTRPNLAL
ncbi:MAG: hypothetical protein ACREFO_10730 [Acetobacteraceae bacterium]